MGKFSVEFKVSNQQVPVEINCSRYIFSENSIFENNEFFFLKNTQDKIVDGYNLTFDQVFGDSSNEFEIINVAVLPIIYNMQPFGNATIITFEPPPKMVFLFINS